MTKLNLYLRWLCLACTALAYPQDGMLPVGSNADALALRIDALESSKIGTRLPAFIAADWDESVFSSVATKRVVFYYFWYDCGDGCLLQFNVLNDLQEKYAGKADFVSLTYMGKTEMSDVFNTHPLRFRNCRFTPEELADLGLSFGYPLTVITVDGVIVLCRTGGPTTAEAVEKRKVEYEKVLDKWIR